MKRICILAFIFFTAVFMIYAQTRPRLAILPFTGPNTEDAETLAEFFSFEPVINEYFAVLPRTQAMRSVMKEQQFQRSGLTDPETIKRQGLLDNADYVLAGHITQLGQNRKLLFITVFSVEKLQMIAGDFREYGEIQETLDFLPEMAYKISLLSGQNTSGKPSLAILPFDLQASGENLVNAEVLTQILSIEIVSTCEYAVFPRTMAIERVMAEHNIQRSGMNDPDSIRRIGAAVNAEHVLSANLRSVGSTRHFSAMILRTETGTMLPGGGARKQYQNISDGIWLMSDLARELTGSHLKFEVKNNKITITQYTGAAQVMFIPERINGFPVMSIGEEAFADTGLTSVTIPSSVTSIGRYAFSGTELTDITIPSSVFFLQDNAFGGTKLANITVNNQNQHYSSMDGVLFDKNMKTLIKYPKGKNGKNYNIPSSVIYIGSHAFEYTGLTSVTIPSSVTSIGMAAFANTSLTSVTIPSSVTSIGIGAFNWTGLTSVTIPSSVTYVGNGAFYTCASLTSVTISRRTKLGDSVFPPNTRISYRD